MTVAAALLPRDRSSLKQSFEQLLIPVDSQSLVRADAHFQSTSRASLIIVHGLEGSSSSDYVLGLAAKALSTGFSVIRLNLRNCGNTAHLSPTLYNAGQSEDLVQVIKWLSNWRAQDELYLIGYSLGGNLVLKALAEIGPNLPTVAGACVVSPSIDLAASVKCLGKGASKIYAYLFLRSLRKKIAEKSRLFPRLYDASKLSKIKDLYSFDDIYTAPHAGYRGADHYYQSASSKLLLKKINKPTLIITAKDDPIVPFDAFKGINNPYLHLLSPDHGGHVAFLASHDHFWADTQIISFCQQQSKKRQSATDV
jgi:predicted alpha/beta-fold hydrolase